MHPHLHTSGSDTTQSKEELNQLIIDVLSFDYDGESVARSLRNSSRLAEQIAMSREQSEDFR
jgi:hypothetical protein